jgi:prophage antirepressor-like protein
VSRSLTTLPDKEENMADLILFHFEQSEIRFVGTADHPEWIAADVCKVLGIVNVSDALSDFEEDEAGIVSTDIRSEDGTIQSREVLTVKEAGLYRLIFKSKKPAAKRMKRWVMHEVLPSIRKTGSYSVAPQVRQLPPIRDTIEYIQAKQYLETCDDPIFKSYAMQSLYEDMGAKALPSQQAPLVLAAVKARELGYKLKTGDDAQLGKWCKKHLESQGKVQHGRYEVNTYHDDERLAETISAFFN